MTTDLTNQQPGANAIDIQEFIDQYAKIEAVVTTLIASCEGDEPILSMLDVCANSLAVLSDKFEAVLEHDSQTANLLTVSEAKNADLSKTIAYQQYYIMEFDKLHQRTVAEIEKIEQRHIEQQANKAKRIAKAAAQQERLAHAHYSGRR